MKSISVSDQTHKKIVTLKMQRGIKTADELLDNLIGEERQHRLYEHSRKFRELLKKNNQTFKQFLEEARKVREEIANERFSN